MVVKDVAVGILPLSSSPGIGIKSFISSSFYESTQPSSAVQVHLGVYEDVAEALI